MRFLQCCPGMLGSMSFFFFFNDTATTEIYTLPLHDALPISDVRAARADPVRHFLRFGIREGRQPNALIDPQVYLEEHPDATSGLLLEVHLRVDQRVGLPPFS